MNNFQEFKSVDVLQVLLEQNTKLDEEAKQNYKNESEAVGEKVHVQFIYNYFTVHFLCQRTVSVFIYPLFVMLLYYFVEITTLSLYSDMYYNMILSFFNFLVMQIVRQRHSG